MNNYLNYISDDHLLMCVQNLHKKYEESKKEISQKKFYRNKIDIFKMTFDSYFNEIDQETLIKTEISRQIDKSVNNAIGEFHEDVLGGIDGYTHEKSSGYDIKSDDNTLFAEVKNKHNTMNSSSSESVFQKLAKFADEHKQAKCYWVQILAKKSFNEPWFGIINKKEYSHSRVFKISGDRFYELLTGRKNALSELYSILPEAINDYMNSAQISKPAEDSALFDIRDAASKNDLSLLNQIAKDNFNFYSGF